VAETLTNTNGSLAIKQSTGFVRPFYFGTTGQTVVVHLSKTSGLTMTAFGTAHGGSPAGQAVELTAGWYYFPLDVVDTNSAGALAYNCTAGAGGPVDFCDQVQTQVLSDFALNANGQAFVASNIKQNQAFNGFPFVMTSATTHAPQPGLTVTAQRSLGGAGFGVCTNAPTELTNGIYVINLSAADLNANVVMLRFTATGADDINVQLITQP
jgi:hypothetical protein